MSPPPPVPRCGEVSHTTIWKLANGQSQNPSKRLIERNGFAYHAVERSLRADRWRVTVAAIVEQDQPPTPSLQRRISAMW